MLEIPEVRRLMYQRILVDFEFVAGWKQVKIQSYVAIGFPVKADQCLITGVVQIIQDPV